MKAIIDADILCYEFGNMKDLETGELLAWPIVRKFVDERIDNILTSVDASSSVLYLTDSKSNFRNEVATILSYKGHRPADKPPHWQEIRQHLIDNYDAEVQYGVEADDACGITQCNQLYSDPYDAAAGKLMKNATTIICSRDKDLSMIPGWHYSWECGNQKEKKWFVNETDGIRFFYKQLLTGDATDNILGLYRVGEKASCVKALDDMTDELDMYLHVYQEYENRFGSYAGKFMDENAALLWIKRVPQDVPVDELHEEVELRFERLEERLEDEEISEESSDEASVQTEDSEGQD